MKGHANKVIARTCDITEATVKVHMKSILRKIRVDNRTQAAIWAMANGYAADGSNARRLNPDSARNAAAITEAAIRSVAANHPIILGIQPRSGGMNWAVRRAATMTKRRPKSAKSLVTSSFFRRFPSWVNRTR